MAHWRCTYYSSGVTSSRNLLGVMTAAALLAVTSCSTEDESAQRGNHAAPLDGGTEVSDPDISDEEQDDDAAEPESAEQPYEAAEGFEEIAQRLGELPGNVEALVLEDGETLLQLGEGGAVPLASVSKLYVLAALAEAAEGEGVDWMDQLEVTEQVRSLPSGTLQDQVEGYTTTVFDAAHRMISISDNTGTDMIMGLLGRDAVEEAAGEFGHHDPQLMQPFLTTRELFQLRWGVPELGEDWAELEESERRQVLDEVSEEELEITSDDTSRHDLDFAVDWFASAEDIATLHQQLAARAEGQDELQEILVANPGLAETVEDQWWEELSFKGGGLPGVVTGSWHAQAEDGTERTVVMLLRTDDTEDIDDHRTELFDLALDALIAGTETERENDDA